MYVYIYVCMYAGMYVNINVSISICLYVCRYVNIHSYMYVCSCYYECVAVYARIV